MRNDPVLTAILHVSEQAKEIISLLKDIKKSDPTARSELTNLPVNFPLTTEEEVVLLENYLTDATNKSALV